MSCFVLTSSGGSWDGSFTESGQHSSHSSPHGSRCATDVIKNVLSLDSPPSASPAARRASSSAGQEVSGTTAPPATESTLQDSTGSGTGVYRLPIVVCNKVENRVMSDCGRSLLSTLEFFVVVVAPLKKKTTPPGLCSRSSSSP